jgi:hypothetical protein
MREFTKNLRVMFLMMIMTLMPVIELEADWYCGDIRGCVARAESKMWRCKARCDRTHGAGALAAACRRQCESDFRDDREECCEAADGFCRWLYC